MDFTTLGLIHAVLLPVDSGTDFMVLMIRTGIDKSSSAELSEAINSMFAWYRDSAVCYVYLADVEMDSYGYGDLQRLFSLDGHHKSDQRIQYLEHMNDISQQLAESRWFTRGWTLQELLAPKRLEFYSRNWMHLGSGKYLIDVISSITKIKASVIRREDSVMSCSVACRMSWAAARHTTRVEDMAYCLLGLFGINMPLLYGEGEKAFLRLQKEIIQVTDDQTILACEHDHHRMGISSVALARSAASFSNCGSLVPLSPVPGSVSQTHGRLGVTLAGVQVSTFVLSQNSSHFAILDCIDERRPTGRVALRVEHASGSATSTLSVSGRPSILFPGPGFQQRCKPKLFTLQDTWGQQSERGAVRRLLRMRCVVPEAKNYSISVLERYPPEIWLSHDLCRNRHSVRALKLLIRERDEAMYENSVTLRVAFQDYKGKVYGLVEEEHEDDSKSLGELCNIMALDWSIQKEIASSRHVALSPGYQHHWFTGGPFKICIIADPAPTNDVHANLLILVEKRNNTSQTLIGLPRMLLRMAVYDFRLSVSSLLSDHNFQPFQRGERLLAGEARPFANLIMDQTQFYSTTRQRLYMQLRSAWPNMYARDVVSIQVLASTLLLWCSFLVIKKLVADLCTVALQNPTTTLVITATTVATVITLVCISMFSISEMLYLNIILPKSVRDRMFDYVNTAVILLGLCFWTAQQLPSSELGLINRISSNEYIRHYVYDSTS